jgi:hypothetical protein
MAWVRLDDKFPDHAKVAQAGPLASWLYVCGLAYCNRMLTDGFIPSGIIRRLADVDDADDLATRLVDARLWMPTDGGYRVHDYLEYQPSREEAEALSVTRADAGRKGGKQRASNLLEVCLDDAKQTASKRLANAKQTASPLPTPLPPPQPKPIPNGSTDVEQEIPPGAGAQAHAREGQPRDELWDALSQALDDASGLVLTRGERGRRNKALASLRQAGAEPRDILERAASYRQRWPGMDLTATALEANWATLGRPPPAQPARADSRTNGRAPGHSGAEDFARRYGWVGSEP